jgi:predicted Zn-dependent peptidase
VSESASLAYDEAVSFTAAGGWRIVVAPRPDSTTVALRCLVAAGGRHDGAYPGLSRLTERLVFAARGPRHRDLVAAVDRLGGEAASQTTREYAEFHAVAPATEGPALLALVPELARAPALGAAAVGRERGALLAALAGLPPPAQALWDLLLAALWGDHPLARPPGGTLDGVAALDPARVATHHAARYEPAHAVLAAAGACAVDAVRAAAAALPAPATPPGPDEARASTAVRECGRPARPVDAARARQAAEPAALPGRGAARAGTDAANAGANESAPAFRGPGSHYRWAPGEVAHVAVAVPVPDMTHPDRSALRLLDYLLGRGGSSRLYHALRLRRSLVYTCQSVYMPYADAGVFAAQAICAPAQARTVARRLADCLLGLAATPPTEAELAAAQVRYAGSLYRGFETNASLAAILGVETLLAHWEPFAASAARIAAVTPQEIAAVARAYLTSAHLVQAVVGPREP